MLFPEGDAPLLKAWIVKRIENTSDADSDVLADYVIALLKADGDKDTIRKLCEEEIPDFLTEDSTTFLDDVFQAIAYKSYVPGAPPPPPPSKSIQPASNQLPQPSPPSNGVAQPAQRSEPIVATPSAIGSRKRGFHDRGDLSAPYGRDSQFHDSRPIKHPRRGRRGRMDGSRDHTQPYPLLGPAGYAFPPGMPSFDPNNPMEAMLQMQAMNMPFPGIPEQPGHGFQGPQTQSRRPRPCRDFETKGFCSQGSTCPYDHGNQSVFIPPMGQTTDEYDPNDAVITLTRLPDPMSSGTIGLSNNHDLQNRGRGGRRRGRAGRKGGSRAPFSADGPVHDRTKTTIVVENIPEEDFSEDKVREFFSRFGTIVETSMQPYKHLAIVKFDAWKAANEAYRSPKVIFDNRFVKVFWFKEESESNPPTVPIDTASGNGLEVNMEMDDAQGEPELSAEEFQKRQEEAQKQHQERESKRAELEQKRLELQKQQEDLIAKHQEETEKLRAKLSQKDGEDSNTGSSNTEKLKAQLAMLEDQCKIYGIDPEEPDDPNMAAGYRGSRGGFRGRGASFRGRGYMPRRRGAFRGTDGRTAAYAQYSIDNRPKKLAISGADFTSSEKEETLRHYLLNMGEFESVETGPSSTLVSFRDRKTAEKFYYSLHSKELPGVEGQLELAWISTPLPAQPPPPPSSTTKAEDDGAGASAMDGAMTEQEEGEMREEAPSAGRSQRQINMDYEVEDENGWME